MKATTVEPSFEHCVASRPRLTVAPAAESFTVVASPSPAGVAMVATVVLPIGPAVAVVPAAAAAGGAVTQIPLASGAMPLTMVAHMAAGTLLTWMKTPVPTGAEPTAALLPATK